MYNIDVVRTIVYHVHTYMMTNCTRKRQCAGRMQRLQERTTTNSIVMNASRKDWNLFFPDLRLHCLRSFERFLGLFARQAQHVPVHARAAITNLPRKLCVLEDSEAHGRKAHSDLQRPLVRLHRPRGLRKLRRVIRAIGLCGNGVRGVYGWESCVYARVP